MKTATPTERPILFSGPMVRAILDGRKTQTRRVARLTAGSHVKEPGGHRRWHPGDPDAVGACPYGAPGDSLWVRETWGYAVASLDEERLAVYRSTIKDPPRWPSHRPAYEEMVVWRPSIHMPRWASRLSLRVTDVRIERLNKISRDDARAEGIREFAQDAYHEGFIDNSEAAALRWDNGKSFENFAVLWDTINGKRAPWSSNPWVWVVSFQRIGGAA